MPPFTPPKTLISEKISKGTVFTSVKITIQFTGTFKFEITANAENASPTWDEVSLTSNIEATQTFTVSGSVVQYRIIGNVGAVIQTTKTISEKFDKPGIKIELIQ